MVGEVEMKKTILGIVIVGLVALSVFSLSLCGTAAYYSGSSYKGYRLGYGVLGEILKNYIHQSIPMLKIEAPKYVKEGAKRFGLKPNLEELKKFWQENRVKKYKFKNFEVALLRYGKNK